MEKKLRKTREKNVDRKRTRTYWMRRVADVARHLLRARIGIRHRENPMAERRW